MCARLLCCLTSTIIDEQKFKTGKRWAVLKGPQRKEDMGRNAKLELSSNGKRGDLNQDYVKWRGENITLLILTWVVRLMISYTLLKKAG